MHVLVCQHNLLFTNFGHIKNAALWPFFSTTPSFKYTLSAGLVIMDNDSAISSKATAPSSSLTLANNKYYNTTHIVVLLHIVQYFIC